MAIPVPNLLAIPNALVDLLRMQGPAVTPYDVLTTIYGFLKSSGQPPGHKWESIWHWCMMVGQTGPSWKSRVFLDTTPITIDDDDFDRWAGHHLDITLGLWPAGSHQVPTSAATTPAVDYLALSKMLATTIGTNMLQFSQAIALQASAGGNSGTITVLATGKSFDQDQIAKLCYACGVRNTQQIPSIWAVIQASKGKSFDTYRAHLAKSINTWCCSYHIERDKSIFLDAKFFEDLVALRFNPGGPVAQYQSAARGMLILVCRLLTTVEAEYRREYKEVAAHTRNACSIDNLMKVNWGKTLSPAANYMELNLTLAPTAASSS
jgi:hypothetical protein